MHIGIRILCPQTRCKAFRVLPWLMVPRPVRTPPFALLHGAPSIIRPHVHTVERACTPTLAALHILNDLFQPTNAPSSTRERQHPLGPHCFPSRLRCEAPLMMRSAPQNLLVIRGDRRHKIEGLKPAWTAASLDLAPAPTRLDMRMVSDQAHEFVILRAMQNSGNRKVARCTPSSSPRC